MNRTLLNDPEKRNFLILDVALALAVDNMNHFLSLENMEVVHIDEHTDAAQEAWETIERQPESYLQITANINEKAFDIMQSFVQTQLAEEGEQDLKATLIKALKESRPFAKFRYILDDKPIYLAKWYLYRDDCYKKQARQWLINNGLLEDSL